MVVMSTDWTSSSNASITSVMSSTPTCGQREHNKGAPVSEENAQQRRNTSNTKVGLRKIGHMPTGDVYIAYIHAFARTTWCVSPTDARRGHEGRRARRAPGVRSRYRVHSTLTRRRVNVDGIDISLNEWRY